MLVQRNIKNDSYIEKKPSIIILDQFYYKKLDINWFNILVPNYFKKLLESLKDPTYQLTLDLELFAK